MPGLPGFRPLTLDLYSPRAQAVPAADGGVRAWRQLEQWRPRHAAPSRIFPARSAALAAQGYVVASINYRLSQEARFPAALQDVKSAIRWLRGHAPAYGGDTTRLAVWGASAGGQLAALAGVTCGVPRFEPEGEVGREAPSDCAEAVIDWYGAHRLAEPGGRQWQAGHGGLRPRPRSPSAEGRYLGCEPAACAPGLARLASPLAFISVGAPPFLIQHGAADATVSPKQSQKLYDALKQKGRAGRDRALSRCRPPVLPAKSAPDAATVNKAMAQVTEFLAKTFPAKDSNRPDPAHRRQLNAVNLKFRAGLLLEAKQAE